MFDKMTIRATLSDDESRHIAEIHRLDAFVSQNGSRIIYQSNRVSNQTNVHIRIDCNKLTLTTSLHKFWNQQNYGFLRNDNLFTMSEARSAFEMLLFQNGLLPERVRIIYYEVGVNLGVSKDPINYIKKVRWVSGLRKEAFIDAAQVPNRQKTTEKSKYIRRYFKIYDKGFEMSNRSKYRIPDNKNILRIETVVKRCNERAERFFLDTNISEVLNRFYADWSSLFFEKGIYAEKGTRQSEVQRAYMIANLGPEEYQKRIKKELEDGVLTSRQYRTAREFMRDYYDNEKRYRTVISEEEREYKGLLYSVFSQSKE